MKKIFYYFPIFAVMAFTAWLLLAAKVFAYDAPVFPTCIDPQGSEIISQESTAFNPDGTRGVGNVYYRISDDKIMQCYCDESANGSQTNWWKVSGLSQEELEYFQQEGWNYVQNGSNSGFEDAPYLVKSSSFNCKDCLPIPTITPSVTASPSATPTLTPSRTDTPGLRTRNTRQRQRTQRTQGDHRRMDSCQRCCYCTRRSDRRAGARVNGGGVSKGEVK